MLLAPYRVIDLSDSRVQLTGQILARLGADVVAVEPPSGAGSRRLAPFIGDLPGPERSFVHKAWNRGKRSVVIDVASPPDRELLRKLIVGADVLIDDGPGGILEAAGLSDSDVSALNPALVHVSVTPFGLDGPKAQWAATDLTVWASGGPLALTGDADRPPVPIGVPQAFVHGATEAASAALVALSERAVSGLGQRIDVSAQQCVGIATQAAVLAAPNRATSLHRDAAGVKIGKATPRRLYPCRDGVVLVMFQFGHALGPFTRRLMEWMHEAGMCDDATRDKDWVFFGAAIENGDEPVSEHTRITDLIAAFCSTRTKRELLDGAVERSLLMAPVQEMSDVVEWSQLEARQWWELVDGVRCPGGFARLSATALPALGDAPRLGSHTEQLRREPFRDPAVRWSDVAVERHAPLAGLKVLDFTWVMATPAATRVLADYGATVVRVESSRRVDTARTTLPYSDDVPGGDRSVLYGNCNAGKLDVTLDLSTEEGRAVVLDLVRWADVVTESFSPKVMKAWGLDYPRLREVNPSIVMLSSSLFGGTGPLASMAGFGTMAAALSGFFAITGWPDRWPCGPFGAYTDYLTPRFATSVLLAALDHRRRTGEGQHIDLSQTEAAMQALAPALLRRTVDGVEWGRAGVSDLNHAPHGAYECDGDTWVAVACATDAERAALRSMVGGLDDGSIGAWCAQRTADVAMHELQSIGVPAHTVQNSAECFADPQLRHRRHYVELDHPVTGTMVIEGAASKLSATPAVVHRAPTLGEHTYQVLAEILGYDDERITELLGGTALV